MPRGARGGKAATSHLQASDRGTYHTGSDPGQETHMGQNTGATYSCIGKEGSHLPLSQSSIKTIGFSGMKQIMPLTEPVPMTIEGKVVYAPLLYSTDTPINLMGRVILCELKAKIMCTQDGIHVDFPPPTTETLQCIMALTMPHEEDTSRDCRQEVYWIRLKEDSTVYHQWKQWKPWVQAQFEPSLIKSLTPHCTLKFDASQLDLDYQEGWNDLMNKKKNKSC